MVFAGFIWYKLISHMLHSPELEEKVNRLYVCIKVLPSKRETLAYRLLRWPNSKPTLGQRLLFAGQQGGVETLSECIGKLINYSRPC